MRIAVTCEMDYMGNAQMRRSICNQDYVDFVKFAGFSPYIVGEGMDVDAIAADMDGLLLTGGKDLNPMIIGEDLAWNGAKKCNIVRDIFERDLFFAFVAAGKPVFGICRGFQLIGLLSNKELRRFFEQDINKLKAISLMHQQGEIDIVGDNPVHIIECRGALKKLVGPELQVNSFHHQGFVMGTSTGDHGWIRQCEDIFCWARSRETGRVLEAFGMYMDGVRVAGVQYHPERMLRGLRDREKHVALFKYTMGALDCDWEPEPPEQTQTTTVRRALLGPTYRLQKHRTSLE